MDDVDEVSYRMRPRDAKVYTYVLLRSSKI
jgi:hypothetical protein